MENKKKIWGTADIDEETYDEMIRMDKEKQRI